MLSFPLLLSACSGPDAPPRDTAPASEAPACSGPTGARVGDCALPLALPTVDGPTFSLEEHLGEIVVVHVASTGSELDPDASQFIAAEIASGGVVAVDVLAVDPVSPPLGADDAAAWRDALELAYPVAWDAAEQVAELWAETIVFPTILAIDREGVVVARVHERYAEQLPAALDAIE